LHFYLYALLGGMLGAIVSTIGLLLFFRFTELIF
jgi:hypothetical protein